MKRIGIVCPPLVRAGLGHKLILFLADGDVKIATTVNQFWSHVNMRTCSGHLNENAELSIEDKVKKNYGWYVREAGNNNNVT